MIKAVMNLIRYFINSLYYVFTKYTDKLRLASRYERAAQHVSSEFDVEAAAESAPS